MRGMFRRAVLPLAFALAAGCLSAGTAWAQKLTAQTLLSGLRKPHGVAKHPFAEDIFFSEEDAGMVQRYRGGSASPVVSEDSFRVDLSHLPKWAYTDQMTPEDWGVTQLRSPGPVSVASNGTLYVTEQIANGRILEFPPDDQGNYPVAVPVPVPWLKQEFRWYDIHVDTYGRLFIAGMDEIGSPAMRFGSVLVRETDGDWWVMDFGPFAQFKTLALSARQDVAIIGDANKGRLTWWEVNKHIMVGGNPDTTGKEELEAVSLFPDGSFLLATHMPGGKSTIRRMDPFVGQQTTISESFRSVGAIAVDRKASAYYITDPEAGTLSLCKPDVNIPFAEPVMRQIARSAEGALGAFGDFAEAPAFMNNFFERLQDAAKDILPSDDTHSAEFTLGDIAGKMPLIAGRVKAVANLAGIEEDPIQTLEFFLLFPSKMVLTDRIATPSVSFFYAVRKSGKIEQTKPVFREKVKVLRLSGTNTTTLGESAGGIYVPVVSCGMEERDNGIAISVTFLGMGEFADYFVSMYQSQRSQSARIVVKDPGSKAGYISYEASFIDEAEIAGMEGGPATREQISNLLVSGFGGGGGGNRSVGWLRLGKYPASMLVSFADVESQDVLGATGGLQEVIAAKEVALRAETAEEVAIFDPNYVPEKPAEETDESLRAALFGGEEPDDEPLTTPEEEAAMEE